MRSNRWASWRAPLLGSLLAAGFAWHASAAAVAGVVIRAEGPLQRFEVSGITGEELARALSAAHPVDFRFNRPELAARRVEGVGVGPTVVEAMRKALAQTYNFAAFQDETSRRTVIVVLGEADAATVTAAASRPLPSSVAAASSPAGSASSAMAAHAESEGRNRPAVRVHSPPAPVKPAARSRTLDDFRKVKEPDAPAVNDAIPPGEDIQREMERYQRERVQRAIDVLASSDAIDLRDAAIRDLLTSNSPQATAALRDLLSSPGAAPAGSGPAASADQVLARVRVHLDAINYDPARTDAIIATLNASSAPVMRAAAAQLAADVAAYRARQR